MANHRSAQRVLRAQDIFFAATITPPSTAHHHGFFNDDHPFHPPVNLPPLFLSLPPPYSHSLPSYPRDPCDDSDMLRPAFEEAHLFPRDESPLFRTEFHHRDMWF